MPPVRGKVSEFADKIKGSPSCVTVRVRDVLPTLKVTVPVRLEAGVLASTFIVTHSLLPVPDDGVTVIQSASLVVDQLLEGLPKRAITF